MFTPVFKFGVEAWDDKDDLAFLRSYAARIRKPVENDFVAICPR
jgi:hypothetical protein